MVEASEGNGQATVSWSASTSKGPAVTGYIVTSTPDGMTCTTTALTCTVTALTNGTPYKFNVVATNSVGNSAASLPIASVTPLGPPDAPTNVTAKATGTGDILVSWNAPANDGGLAITNYTATALGGEYLCQSRSTSCVITGFTNNGYFQFKVVAQNEAGTSPSSSPSNEAEGQQ
jgi:titin